MKRSALLVGVVHCEDRLITSLKFAAAAAFSAALVWLGQGVTAALLRRHGIEVVSEEEWEALRKG